MKGSNTQRLTWDDLPQHVQGKILRAGTLT